VIGDGEIFLMNPDEPASLDGCYFGPIPIAAIAGKVSITNLADRIMGICLPERMKELRAFHMPLNDPDLEAHAFRDAVDTIEYLRKHR
jgi:hypothetical protein